MPGALRYRKGAPLPTLPSLARAQRSLDDLAGGRERHLADELEVLRPFSRGDAVLLLPVADLQQGYALAVAREDKHTDFLAHEPARHGHLVALQHLYSDVDEDPR